MKLILKHAYLFNFTFWGGGGEACFTPAFTGIWLYFVVVEH